MNMRAVVTSAMWVLAAMSAGMSAGCGKQQSAASADAKSSASSASSAPGMGYEAHVNAGGVAPPAQQALQPPKGNAGDAKAGEGLFSSMNCDGCHGGGATGWEGPSLVDGRWRYGGGDEEIFQSIFYGRPKGMPAYGGVVGADGVWMIVAYLKSQPVPNIVPTTNYDEIAKAAAAAPASASASASTTASAAHEGKQPTDTRGKLAQYGCTACHAIDKKVVGPSFQDVAAKYHGQSDAAQLLEAKVKNGGAGAWGNIPMPPQSAPDADVHELVNWILTSPDVRK
jgi:cytochrome c551/c552